MHLQSLELLGFKSFADKTIFNFHEGITAIVGPNGCGKSNVLDAVRWVLGEQSAKSLRGDEMADVIFNGSDTRKPVGFAEVSVTFTDCAKELAVDWHDVRVTRRVYRDGNSEYFLNKTPCRLRDVQTLFADTGIARAAYSMMEQGKIDMVLSSRPEDRRAVFEEAAGITKYKAQKREALRKLEATEANLLRIGDVIKEVKRQIGSLQRQAGKARRYQALHADLRVLDTHNARRQFDSLEADLAGCHAEIAHLGKSEEATRAMIDESENRLADQRHDLDQIDMQIVDAQSESQRLQSEISAHHNQIQFNRQRAEELTDLIQRSRKDIGAAEVKHAQQAKEIAEANELIKETSKLLKVKEAELTKLTERISKLRGEQSEHESKLDVLRAAIAKNQKRINESQAEISGLAIRRETTQENRRGLGTAISEARGNRKRVEKEIAVARATAEAGRKNADLSKAKVHTTQEKLRQHEQFLASTEKSLGEIGRTLAEKESRFQILRKLDEEGAGLSKGVQAVLGGLDDPSRIRAALAGALVSNLDMDPEYTAAIGAALGRNVQAIVLNDARLAPEIIAALKEKKIGQVALMIPTLCSSAPKNHLTVLPRKAVAWARDKVKPPDSLAPLVTRLLGNVAIFSNLDDALAWKRHENNLAAATLGGEFVSAEGILFGGSREPAIDSSLERKRRISVLNEECIGLRKERDVLLRKVKEANAILQKARQEFEQARQQYDSAGREEADLENRILFLDRELRDAEEKIDRIHSEHTTLSQQIETADKRIEGLEEELDADHASLEAQQKQRLEIQAAAEKAAKREAEATEQLHELRLALATKQQHHENLVGQRQPMIARETELAETIATRQVEIAGFEKRLGVQAEESKGAQAAIEKQKAQCADLGVTLTALTGQRAKHSAATNEAESNLRTMRNSLTDVHDSRSKQQVRESHFQMQIDNLAERISRCYKLNLREFAPDQVAFEKTLQAQLKRSEKLEDGVPATVGLAELAPSDVETLIADLTRQLDNMGPVNLDAVHEYDELEERYKFLEAQNNDLTNSRRELLDVIAQINSTTRKLFAETFAQVRVNFREMFSEIFGGGRADLSLLDENDPLNCGIEVSAKPPGKQLQSVSLLSGGERSMVAVALLFAIYMVRPSPFCILDEVDAAMDEGNINCFIRVLERFVKQSQFIIMTHNKRTIAKADVLYGVTMEEQGVSKLVGMKLTPPRQASAELASDGGQQRPRQQRLAFAAR